VSLRSLSFSYLSGPHARVGGYPSILAVRIRDFTKKTSRIKCTIMYIYESLVGRLPCPPVFNIKSLVGGGADPAVFAVLFAAGPFD